MAATGHTTLPAPPEASSDLLARLSLVVDRIDARLSTIEANQRQILLRLDHTQKLEQKVCELQNIVDSLAGRR